MHDFCKDHNKYDGSGSDDYDKVDDTFKIGYGKGGVEGMTVKDTVYLTDNIEIKKQIFGAVTKTETERKGYDGLIGKYFSSYLSGFAIKTLLNSKFVTLHIDLYKKKAKAKAKSLLYR